MKLRSSVIAALGSAVAGVAAYDVVQRKHAILHNFPLIGHLRYLLEGVGPELRQYIVTTNDEERPFSRDERRWVYTSAKRGNRNFGFGTDSNLEQVHNFVITKHSAFPISAGSGTPTGPDPDAPLPAAKVLGGARARARAFRPSSLVNISGMSYGSLSAAAVTALNLGAARAGCLHTTGEGGVSPYHLNGGDLVLQIGTAYFGCREPDGRFSLPRLIEQVESTPTIRAIELKLSQGAKPGLGGLLPAAKVTPEIAAIRGIPVGKDCHSPAAHSAFRNVDEMLELVETIADATGLPVGVKSAVGHPGFWDDLAERISTTGRAVDFITIDGGEGGTGAAPRTFTDHVALPFKWAFARVYRTFAARGLQDDVVFVGSARLGLPENALFALALGCDMVNVGRTAMFSIGCVQAQRCHTGKCPTGVTSHAPWLQAGLDPAEKSDRCAWYLATLRYELLTLAHACGVAHPGLVTADMLELLEGNLGSVPITQLFDYQPGWGLPSPHDREAIVQIMEALPGDRVLG
jgi:glutamate synthase domain-containing protein 2